MTDVPPNTGKDIQEHILKLALKITLDNFDSKRKQEYDGREEKMTDESGNKNEKEKFLNQVRLKGLQKLGKMLSIWRLTQQLGSCGVMMNSEVDGAFLNKT